MSNTQYTDKINNEDLRILQHTLGLDQYGNGKQYRNYYCVPVDQASELNLLVGFGFMEETHRINGGKDAYYRVTPKGIDYVALNSPIPPKVSRSKRRYQNYLRAGDSGCESFKDFLTNPYWERLRNL